MSDTKLTDEDKAMLVYFHEERGDMTRWHDWSRVWPLLAAEYPEIIDAMDRLEIATRTLDACVKQIKL